MRKIIHSAVRLYPALWRERYEPEFAALLEDMDPGFGDLLNIVKGALLMQFNLSNIPLMAATFAVLGIFAALFVSIERPRRYESTAVIAVRTDQPDAIRQVLVFDVGPSVLSDESLSHIIEQNGLYPSGRGNGAAADALRRFRESITVEPIGDSTTHQPIGNLPTLDAFKVSFTYPDSQKAQKVTADLVRRFIEENLHVREREAADDWIHYHLQMRLIDPPDQVPLGASLIEMIGLGLGAGALAGAAIALVRRRIKASA